MVISLNTYLSATTVKQNPNNSQKMDTLFLKELLAQSGLFRPPEAMSGGIGEQQFSSLLLDEYAHILARDLQLNLLRGSADEI